MFYDFWLHFQGKITVVSPVNILTYLTHYLLVIAFNISLFHPHCGSILVKLHLGMPAVPVPLLHFLFNTLLMCQRSSIWWLKYFSSCHTQRKLKWYCGFLVSELAIRKSLSLSVSSSPIPFILPFKQINKLKNLKAYAILLLFLWYSSPDSILGSIVVNSTHWVNLFLQFSKCNQWLVMMGPRLNVILP